MIAQALGPIGRHHVVLQHGVELEAARYKESGDASIIWEGHKAGRHRGYCQIEKLHNLEALPADGFVVSCFPVKIRAASGGWTRAVAILD